MARDFFVNGESLVLVKGNSSTIFPLSTQLGLAVDPIRITPEFRHKDITVDAWGEAPAEVQVMLAWVNISMNLEHIDRALLDAILQESMGGAPAIGQLARAGARMGNNLARFQSVGPAPNQSNHFIGLNIASPVGNKPWRFYFSYLTGPPVEIPLGAEKSIFRMNWRAIPYTQDPANIVGGVITGAQGYVLWDHLLDT